MEHRISGWNMFVGERMKSVHNLAEVDKRWRDASEEEKRVWNELSP